MNFDLPFVPKRQHKPRTNGVNMIMDKGLSLTQTQSMIESAGEFIDLVKFGFGTSIITHNLPGKIDLYRKANIIPYFGGTLFEAFIIRNKFAEYIDYLKSFDIQYVEVSDGSMKIPHTEKLKYIEELSKYFTVISEVGSKQRGVFISSDRWVNMMAMELEAGAWKVIAEARESGTIGIYNNDGSANESLINNIIDQIKNENIIWEAPSGQQQVWFIKLLGPEVNLGNIAPDSVIPLECLRLGLRGDTFLDFLPDEFKKERSQQINTVMNYIDFQI